MNILIVNIMLVFIIQRTLSVHINQTLLIEKYEFSIDSSEIDLSESSISSIDIDAFKGFNKLEKLFLQNNKLRELEYGLFNHLSNLRELWLESNNIVSINRNVFIGLNKLEKVCLSDNPISFLFPNNIKPLCETNLNCNIKINEKCTKDNTSTLKLSSFQFIDYYIYI